MARADMFLKATGQRTGEIRGESNDKTFPNQIEVIDWNWGMSAPTAVGGQRTARTQFRELKIVKTVDNASTALMSVMTTNELMPTVVLTVRKSGGLNASLPYFKMTLEGARISEYDVQSDVNSTGAPTLTEHVSFSFKRVTIDYTLQGGDGGGRGGTQFSADAGPSA